MERQATADPACERCVELLHERLDGSIEAPAARELEAHLASCAACRQVQADLEDIRRLAPSLPDLSPRAEVWAGLARRLDAERAARPRPLWRGRNAALAVAAVLVVAIASSLYVLRPPRPSPRTPPAAGAPVIQSPRDLVEDIDEHLRIADEHYVQAIAGLEEIVKSGEASLDPLVAETLQKNLGVIDTAIRESREAIQSQPNSQLAQTSLFEALRQKVALLEDAVALINVMRKGDQEGAAKIIGGISKS
ncbi:MAG TPA: zf-HC2 domain-containing protein [Vicinamibacterales bacterium]|nr:zf-HC2 domain-containing protein [Vicinamibacterales bacterium]